MVSLRASLAALAGLAPLASGYVWPGKYDFLESIMYQHLGYRRDFQLASSMFPCDRPFTPGRSLAAEWVRAAFHDMSTADVAAGTGGLDGSLVFEADREENKGPWTFTAFDVFRILHTSRSSFSDVIALAAVLAVSVCSDGRVNIPYRAGRIDADGPGPYGVPMPEETLQTHTERFAKMGFNVQEMIALTACGHTLGGVHGADNPHITDQLLATFDITPSVFDARVALDFVANTTTNPLVVGANETIRSDKRIFNADGGAQITSMRSLAAFSRTCQSLMGRMIDVVPRGVVLSEVFQPIPVKPEIIFSRLANGTMVVRGEIRLLNPVGSDGPPERQVLLHWRARGASFAPCSAEQPCTAAEATTRPELRSSGMSRTRPSFNFYEFLFNVPPQQGVSFFTIEIIENGQSTLHDNEGQGYRFNDAVMVDTLLSCSDVLAPDFRILRYNMFFSARDTEYSNFTFIVSNRILKPGSHDPGMTRFEDVRIPMRRMADQFGGYSLYAGTFEYVWNSHHPQTFDIEASGPNGTVTTEFTHFVDLSLRSCSSGKREVADMPV